MTKAIGTIEGTPQRGYRISFCVGSRVFSPKRRYSVLRGARAAIRAMAVRRAPGYVLNLAARRQAGA